MFYLACQNCRKKVFDEGSSYRCDNCDKSFDDAMPVYNFSVLVSDCSSSLRAQCLGECGEDILGMKGAEFYKDYHEDYDKMKTLRQ